MITFGEAASWKSYFEILNKQTSSIPKEFWFRRNNTVWTQTSRNNSRECWEDSLNYIWHTTIYSVSIKIHWGKLMSIPFVNFNRELGAPFYGRSPYPKFYSIMVHTHMLRLILILTLHYTTHLGLTWWCAINLLTQNQELTNSRHLKVACSLPPSPKLLDLKYPSSIQGERELGSDKHKSQNY